MHADLTQIGTDSTDLNAITELIIGRAHVVSNALRTGFLEKIYQNALAHELRKVGRLVSQQQNISVYYDRIIVEVYAADLLVENAVMVELKQSGHWNRSTRLNA
jgi:GxxExxY protein